MMPDRPRLLMVSPVMPALFGNGLAMRAAMSLRALAHYYRVSLLVAPYYSSPAGKQLAPALAERCELVVFKPGNFATQVAAASVSGPLAGPFNVVHVFRLASLQLARSWFERAAGIHLDLDDVESVSRPGIAALYRKHGRLKEAAAEEKAGHEALQMEIEALMHFDRVYVCSAQDVERLPFCGAADVRVLPNVVDIPSSPLQPPPPGQPFTFLFVGNLGYLPNAEGLDYFATALLPRLRQEAPGLIRIQVAGHGASPALKHLAQQSGIDMVGPVTDITPRYIDANAVIVPIRAGGGTRIKVLEAFSFRRPVVSTTMGVEGIAAQHQVHALVADEPDAFAAACLRLMAETPLRDHLAERAFQLVTTSYTVASMISAVAPDVRRLQPR